MKTSPLTMTAAVGLFVLLGGSTASAQSGALLSHIPFAFTVGTTTMEAGTYAVSLDGVTRTTLTVRNSNQRVIALSTGGRSDASDKPTRLVFHRYGQRYFLREVWFAGNRAETLPERDEESILIQEKWRIAASEPAIVSVVASLR
jgi:hypothetical protein